MAERDPFGRRLDEDTLAGLGSLSDTTAAQTGEPAVVASAEAWSEPAEPAAPPSRPSRPAAKAGASAPRASSPTIDASLAEVIRQAEQLGMGDVTKSVRTVGRVVKVAVFLVVLGVIAGVGGMLVTVGEDVRDAVGDLPSASRVADEAAPGAASEPAVAPVGLSSSSMLTRRNFDRAMDRLSRSGLGRMRTMAIRPERIDAQLLTKGGSLRSVQIRSGDPQVRDFGTGGSGFSHLETIPFARIDRAAPARLARSAAGRARRPVSQVDYVVLQSFAGATVWNAYLKGGRGIFQADSRGRITRRIS